MYIWPEGKEIKTSVIIKLAHEEHVKKFEHLLELPQFLAYQNSRSIILYMNDDIQWMKYDIQTKSNILTGHLFVASLQLFMAKSSF